MRALTAASIPYGISDFRRVRAEGRYYVDKTGFLPALEVAGDFLFFVRPRRFGKSLFLDMLRCYYDLNEKKNFKKLFDGLAIAEKPTANRNRYMVLGLDFSKVGGSDEASLAEGFREHVSNRLDAFVDVYRTIFDAKFRKAFASKSTASKFASVVAVSKRRGIPIYLIIDEYDNFTNALIRAKGNEPYRAITHGTGFYREWFKKFKGDVDRIFMTGVSPVTMDDLTSGFNIATNITCRATFNAMLGFTADECVKMYSDFKGSGEFTEGDPAAVVASIKPWYDGYCFSSEKLGRESVFNSDMALYHLKAMVELGRPPENMVDRNISTDYAKLETIAELQRKASLQGAEDVLPIVDALENDGALPFELVDSFPVDRIADPANFKSLFFYYGIVTMAYRAEGTVHYGIPNACIRRQVYDYLRDAYHRLPRPDWSRWDDFARGFAYRGEWRPFLAEIAKNYAASSPVRACLQGEIRVQGYLQAEFGHLKHYLACPELELAGGYGDFFLFPERVYYGDVPHSYIIEVKQAKKNATAAVVAKLAREATAQLKRYAKDEKVPTLAKDTTLHCLVLVFKGKKMAVCRELKQ